MNEKNLISQPPVRRLGRIGVVPYDVDSDTAAALDAGRSGSTFDWNKAVTALISAGLSIYMAQKQADAARNAYNAAANSGQNIYASGYNATGSITQYLPYIAVGVLALVLILRK